MKRTTAIKTFDPRLQLAAFLSLVAWISTTSSILGGFAWVAVAVAGIVYISIRGRVAVSYGSLAAMVLIMSVLTFVLYFLFSLDQPAHALEVGVRMVLRLIALTLFALLFVSIADPLGLAAGVTKLLLPLRRVGIPVARVFYLTFFLVRMIPHLLRESRILRLAQQSRGVLQSGNLLGRLQSAPTLVIPVFAAGLRRGEQTALALGARGFDSECIPSAVHDLHLRRADIIALNAIAVGWCLWIAMKLS